MIEEQQYDLCLIDIRLPAMNGKELYQWLEEKHPQQAGRAIFTTGSVIGQDTMTFVEKTGRLFLPKPFTPEELKAKIRKALKRVEK